MPPALKLTFKFRILTPNVCTTYANSIYFQTIGKTNISQEDGSLLEGIHQALLRESITTEIMVGLLTLLCVLLTTLVVYLCYTRGIASLSRYVM